MAPIELNGATVGLLEAVEVGFLCCGLGHFLDTYCGTAASWGFDGRLRLAQRLHHGKKACRGCRLAPIELNGTTVGLLEAGEVGLLCCGLGALFGHLLRH